MSDLMQPQFDPVGSVYTFEVFPRWDGAKLADGVTPAYEFKVYATRADDSVDVVWQSDGELDTSDPVSDASGLMSQSRATMWAELLKAYSEEVGM